MLKHLRLAYSGTPDTVDDMNKRHEDQLSARLDSLYANGTTFISYDEIYYWYRLQRISKHPWRDIKSRWGNLLQEVGEDYKDPRTAQVRGGVAFFFSQKPGTLSKLAE
jgi:hypothetical protein